MAVNTYLERNLTRLRAVSYKLQVIKNRVDAIIARLEAKQYDRYFDHDDFNYDHVQGIDSDALSLSERVLSALQEMKG